MAKLVDILARELKEWPHEAASIAQDHDSCAHPYNSSEIEFNHGEWGGKDADVMVSSYNVRIGELSDDHATSIVTRAEWQAAVDALKKAEVVEWDGVGLPAVGAVCEIKLHAAWTSVEVIAHYANQAVIGWSCPEGENVELRCAGDLRPIRTPEQIAAEEREKTAYIMMVDAGVDDKEWSRQLCLALYDAGYRKQEPK